MEPVKLAILPLVDAKELQDQLKKQNVEIILNHNEQTCTRGCSVTVEVLGFEKDFEAISKTYQENFKKMVEGHDVNWNIIDAVFDPSKDHATCPACGFEFSTDKTECPDCGLVLG